MHMAKEWWSIGDWSIEVQELSGIGSFWDKNYFARVHSPVGVVASFGKPIPANHIGGTFAARNAAREEAFRWAIKNSPDGAIPVRNN